MSNSTIRWSVENRNVLADNVICLCLEDSHKIEDLRENSYTQGLILESQYLLPAELVRTSISSGTMRSIISASLEMYLGNKEYYDSFGWKNDNMGEQSEPTVVDSAPTIDTLGVDGFMDLLHDAITHPVYSAVLRESILELLGTSVVRAGTPIILSETMGSSMLNMAKAPMPDPVKLVKPIKGLMAVKPTKIKVLIVGLKGSQKSTHLENIDEDLFARLSIKCKESELNVSAFKNYDIVLFCTDFANHSNFTKLQAEAKKANSKQVFRKTSVSKSAIAHDMQQAFVQYKINKGGF